MSSRINNISNHQFPLPVRRHMARTLIYSNIEFYYRSGILNLRGLISLTSWTACAIAPLAIGRFLRKVRSTLFNTGPSWIVNRHGEQPFKKSYLFLILLCLILVGCGNSTDSSESSASKPEKITIATAANMQFAMNELTQEFSKSSGVQCDVVIGSSGNLTAQIKEGAPYDIFVAANMKYPNDLFNSGMSEAPPAIYATGRLVLWTMIHDINPSLDELTTSKIQHIALANPKLAPYGSGAIQVLQHHKLLEKVRHKLVYGESIAQTNQFITSRSAETGFTALSVVLSPQMKGKGRWTEMDQKTYTPIEQGVIIIKHENFKNSSNHSRNSGPQQFLNFLFSAKAQKILKYFGYLVHE